MDSPHIEKVVAFGGKIYNCLNEYDNGNKDAFNVIIDQLSDPLLDYKVLMKLLKEVRPNISVIRKTLSILTSLATPTNREFSLSKLEFNVWVTLKRSGLKEFFGFHCILLVPSGQRSAIYGIPKSVNLEPT